MPMPNHCIECDKPLPKDSLSVECDACKERQDSDDYYKDIQQDR